MFITFKQKRFINMKIIMLGCGFGGVEVASELSKRSKLRKRSKELDIFMIDRRARLEYPAAHPEILSGKVTPEEISGDLNKFASKINAEFINEAVVNIDFEAKNVKTEDEGEEIPYDFLVISIGAEQTFFGIPGAEELSQEQMGVEASSEQLIELDKRMGGHPLSLLMFASLADEMDVNMILDNLPETGIEKYLYDEIYKRLNDNEQRVLEAISIFRTPVTLEACVSVSKGDNIKKTLISLEEKLLVKRKEKLYYLHDLIRDFSYNLIDNPKEYHRLAGEYYAQLEKIPENILGLI